MSVRSLAAMSECSVAAYGIVAASRSDLPALRETPNPSGRHPIPPRFLRHSDEQTVVGLAAVLRAMDAESLRDTCFDQWGVVAAPMFPGRLGGAATFRRYQQGGTAAISPHIIPQNSLHSVSSAISISLGMRGPNFGIGGGPEALAEGLLVAMTLLDPRILPGLWLVLTQWAPEPVPDGLGSTATETTCLAVALGLRHGMAQDQEGLTLRLAASAAQTAGHTRIRVVPETAEPPAGVPAEGEPAGRSDYVPLLGLARWLDGEAGGRSASWTYGLSWGGRIELMKANYRQRTKAA